jgi:internalin A
VQEPPAPDQYPLLSDAVAGQLTSLTCSGYDYLKSLGTLSNLEVASLSRGKAGCTIETLSLEPLSRCAKLRKLEARETPVTSLEGLSGCAKLQELDVRGCRLLTNLSGIEGCTQLSSLDVAYCRQLTNLRGIEGCTQLSSLGLRYTTVSSLAPLSGMCRLERLDLSNCAQVTSLRPLSGSCQLQHLNVNGCLRIHSLWGVQGCPQLRELRANHIPVTCLDALAKLYQLEYLELEHCEHLTDSTREQALRSVRARVAEPHKRPFGASGHALSRPEKNEYLWIPSCTWPKP